MNLENYSLRDKILFNPTLPVKRATEKANIDLLVSELEKLLRGDKRIEAVPTPVRISGLTTAAFNLELFCYVLTADIDEFYRIGSELYLKIDNVLAAASVELA
jgi:MscS family membrane protein